MSKTEAKDNIGTNEDLYKAAENGDIESQYSLATLYYEGKETEKNLEKAFYWYQKAAENGFERAQYNLARLYENGEGTEKNLEKAFYWYQKAAEMEILEHNIILQHCIKKGKIHTKLFIGIRK